jgi:hypothetical protein
MYVPTPTQEPESPRVRELSRRVSDLIRDFQRQYPVTPSEIREALRHAGGGADAGRRRPLIVLLAGGAAALGAAVVFGSRTAQGQGEGTGLPVVALAAILAAVLGAAMAIRGRG